LPTIPDQGVCQDNEPAHYRGESKFWRLSSLDQLVVLGFEFSVSLNGYKSWRIDCAPHECATSLNMPGRWLAAQSVLVIVRIVVGGFAHPCFGRCHDSVDPPRDAFDIDDEVRNVQVTKTQVRHPHVGEVLG